MFEDINGVIRSRKSEDIQYNGQKKKNKRSNKTLHRKLNTEQYELY